jgi:hypothetical protein
MLSPRSFFLALALAAAPLAHAADRQQLLILDLDAIEIDAQRASILNGSIASALSDRPDIEALTAADIQTMAKLEADKSAMGCDDASCLAEIANAMGARYVVYGRVGKLDDVILLQLNLFDASIGKSISRQDTQAAKLQEINAKIPELVVGLLKPLGGAPAPAAAQAAAVVETDGPSGLFLAGASVAGVGVLVGLGAGIYAFKLNGDLTSREANLTDKQTALDIGIPVALTAIGGGVVAAGGLGLLGFSLME